MGHYVLIAHDPSVFFTRTWLRYVRVFAIAIPSVVCLSVCNVAAPYSGGWTFRHNFFTAVYAVSSDLREKFYGDSPRGTPPLGALNARWVSKYGDFEPIEGYIS